MSAQRATIESGVLRRSAVTPRAMPTTTAFSTVPRPGRSRSGIQISRMKKLVTIVAVPMFQPVCSATPPAKTVQGELPSSATTSSASPAPNSHRPAISRSSCAGPARQPEELSASMRSSTSASARGSCSSAGTRPSSQSPLRDPGE